MKDLLNNVLFLAGAIVFGAALAISIFENIRMSGGF